MTVETLRQRNTIPGRRANQQSRLLLARHVFVSSDASERLAALGGTLDRLTAEIRRRAPWAWSQSISCCRRVSSWAAISLIVNARMKERGNTYGVTVSERTGRCFACPAVWEPREDGTTDWAIYGLTKQLGAPGARQYTAGAIFVLCVECTGLVSGARSIDDWIAIISRSPASVGQSEIRMAQTALAAMSIFDEAVLLRPDQLDDFRYTFADIDVDDADGFILGPRHAPP